jgi:hypothetical protein
MLTPLMLLWMLGLARHAAALRRLQSKGIAATAPK